MDAQADFQHRVFSINEAAAHLRISRSFLYALIGEERLRPIKFGNRTVLTGGEIARFIRAVEDARQAV
jgi:excisionase family DNA binding protein